MFTTQGGKGPHLNKHTKTAILLVLLLPVVIAALVNVSRGHGTNPAAYWAVTCGVIAFAIGKLSVVTGGNPLHFGSRKRTPAMEKLYRFGFLLIVAGCLLTFLP